MLADKPFRELLAAFAAPVPTPAGGAASALASAVGASLLLMAATLPKSRTGSTEERQRLADAAVILTPLHKQLMQGIDDDADAYRRLMSAQRDAKQDALKTAIEAPVQVVRQSAGALAAAPDVAGHCHRAAASDVRVAIELLWAGLVGARSTARANLRRLDDRRYVERVEEEIARLSIDAAAAAEIARGVCSD
jgi:formiminotetrahydrofolate cyclodeaminase